jgi:hypothetical protein
MTSLAFVGKHGLEQRRVFVVFVAQAGEIQVERAVWGKEETSIE